MLCLSCRGFSETPRSVPLSMDSEIAEQWAEPTCNLVLGQDPLFSCLKLWLLTT